MRMDDGSKLEDKNLALFFTAGVSLKSWYNVGSIEREVALYNKLSESFNKIYFFTYGLSEDLTYCEHLSDNIIVVPKKIIKNNLLYSLLIPLIHFKIFKNVSIVKTNQMMGSWTAILVKIIFGSKLVLRTGYMLSINYKKEHPKSPINPLISFLEIIAYKTGDAVITTSQSNFEYVEDRYHPSGKHVLLPNYIETEIFKPMHQKKSENSICFVGRLSKEKNLFSLLKALKGTEFTIDIYGSGPLENSLKKFSEENDINAHFRGNVPNHELPEILNRHEIFILVSYYENMPKALLEAMACGLAVLGTDVKGINEVIKNNENGILCKPEIKSIKNSLTYLFDNPEVRENISNHARETILDGYSLNKLSSAEIELLGDLL